MGICLFIFVPSAARDPYGLLDAVALPPVPFRIAIRATSTPVKGIVEVMLIRRKFPDTCLKVAILGVIHCKIANKSRTYN